MGRPIKGKQKRTQVSIKIEPRDKELLKKHFGGVTKAVDFIVRSLRANKEQENE